MKTHIFTYTLCAAMISFGMIGSASAKPPRDCTDVPQSQWMSFDQLSAKAEQLGYTPEKIERKGSCIEVSGEDRNGAKIKVSFNPATGEVVPHLPPPHGFR